MNRDTLRALLIKHEGLVLKMYKDSMGIASIGVGRNLEGQGISEQEAMYLLEGDMSRVVAYCREAYQWFNGLDDDRQNVVASMVFNMGAAKFAEFKKMIAAIVIKDYETASNEMKASTWAAQVGQRAVELSEMMRVGSTIH